jgi:hypothetical protein
MERFNSSLHQQQCLLQASFQDEISKDEAEDDGASLPWWQRMAQHAVSSPV